MSTSNWKSRFIGPRDVEAFKRDAQAEFADGREQAVHPVLHGIGSSAPDDGRLISSNEKPFDCEDVPDGTGL